MDLNLVRVFVTVAEQGSFVKAAHELSLPTSNVSRYIIALEKYLKCRLLERSTRRMHLTPAGQQLYQQAKPTLESLDNIEIALTLDQVDLRGILRLCIPSGASQLIAPILADFALQYPNIEIQCNTDLSTTEDLLESYDIKLLFNRGAMDDSNIIVKQLAVFRSVIVASPDFINQWGRPKTILQLKDFPCITSLTSIKGQPWQFMDKKGKVHKPIIHSKYKVNSGEMAAVAALKGIGIAILAEFTCQNEIASKQLIPIELDLEPAPLMLLAAYLNRQYMPARTRCFLDYLVNKLDITLFL